MGSADIYLTNDQGPIQEIDLAGTSSQSSTLSIAVRRSRLTGGDGRVLLGSITGSGVRTLNAKMADLNGTGVVLNGYVTAVTLGDVLNGADISLTGGSATQKTRLTLGTVHDGTNITVDASVSTLIATSFGTGLIVAPSVGTARINGNFSADVHLNLNGAFAGTPVLGALHVAGNILNSEILVNGDVNSVQALGFSSSRLFAGYQGADDGSDPFTKLATVRSFNITGIFRDSHVIASVFKNVTLRSVDTNNGGATFGFLADLAIGNLRITTPSFKFDPNGPDAQAIDDFEAAIV